MSERIIDGTDFDATKIMYTSPKVQGQGGKVVGVLFKPTKTTLTIATPLLLTWGASDYKKEGEEVGNGKYSLSLQFPSDEYKTVDTDSFLDNMLSFQQKIKSDALIYSKEWFGKVHKNADIIEELFTPMVKYPKNKITGEYDYSKSPSIAVKLPQWEGVWKTEIYDEEGVKLYPNPESPVTPLDFIRKGSNIACLIQFSGIWFVNGKFSASWKLVQAVVQKPKAQLQGQCFIKLKTQDKEKLKTQVVKEDDIETAVIVEDSDGEEMPEEVQEVVKEVEKEVLKEEQIAVAEPVVEVKKKKIIKKKTASES
jgi:hypothetical protein